MSRTAPPGQPRYDDHEERLQMLGLLLENVGVDAAVRLGDPQVWRDAVINFGCLLTSCESKRARAAALLVHSRD